MFLEKIEKSELLNMMNKFKDETATCFDIISVKFLKRTSATLIIEFLVYASNVCTNNVLKMLNLYY